MRLPVRNSARHKGKLLEFDSNQETLTLFGANGQILGRTTWDSVIESILAGSQSSPASESVRQLPRAEMSIAVKYRTAEGKVVAGRTTGIGAGGLFIESPQPLSAGSLVFVEFALPDHPDEWLHATGRVAWVCERPDQYHFHPGMGIKFEEIVEETRTRIVALVERLQK